MRYDEVAAKKAKAARFVRDVREDHDRADEIESESVEDYAERKKLTINPLERKIATVGNDSMTKAELQDCLDQVEAF